MLERRTRPSHHEEAIWQLEQLHTALERAQWGLTPEDRQQKSTCWWTEACKILELDSSEPAPTVDYADSAKHPFWMEYRGDIATLPSDSTQNHTNSGTV